MCRTMCDRCKERLNGGLTDRLSRLTVNDFGMTGSSSSNSDLYFRSGSTSRSDGYGAGTSSSSSHCDLGCACSTCGKLTRSGSKLSGSDIKLTENHVKFSDNDISYRVVRDFDETCDNGCTCDQAPINNTDLENNRKRIQIVTPEPEVDDDGNYLDDKYSSEENLTTDYSSFENVRDVQHPAARYRIIRRNSDSSILDYKSKTAPELPVCKEGSLSASSDSFKNICCRIHEDLKGAFVKGGKPELADRVSKGSWKAAIEAVVKAFFKRKRENSKPHGEKVKLQKKEKKTKKEKQVKTIWRRPTPYIYVTDSYGFRVRRPLHPPEYLDKHNYLYLVSYIDRSYISQLARTDF